ncbi:unnamed protein product [Dibothriocephalus latus]|uniref:Uncharacterized protein n=1 Tax=Dibothriocephalus latus TaxID=60516 RepID=A0A3P7RDA3_DIBLA|nr:unnamed protein product [Dibothriocephalus latus]
MFAMWSEKVNGQEGIAMNALLTDEPSWNHSVSPSAVPSRKKPRVSSTPYRKDQRLSGCNAWSGSDQILPVPFQRPDCLFSVSAVLDSSSSDPATWPSTLEDASVAAVKEVQYPHCQPLSTASEALDLRVTNQKPQDSRPLAFTNTAFPVPPLGSPSLFAFNSNPGNDLIDPPTAISWNLALVNAFFRGFIQRRLSPAEATMELPPGGAAFEGRNASPKREAIDDFGKGVVAQFASPPTVASSMLNSDGGKESVIFYDPGPADGTQKIRVSGSITSTI